MTRAADLLARRLYEAGCRHAFGMPGGEVLTIVDALQKAGIAFHLVAHENAGGFIAEGVHHAQAIGGTFAPAILVGTIGPGIMNAVNTVCNAAQDRVPLVVISGCVDADEALTYNHQVMDHEAVLAPVCKATFRLTAKGAGIIADRAVALALEGRAGPVHIDVPIGVAAAEIVNAPEPHRAPASPLVPAREDLETARAWLRHAERPLVVAGLDAVRDEAGAALLAFCETFGAPLVTTYKAKGLVDETHPLALGGAGLSPLADRHILPLVERADVVILAGYDPIEMRTGWRDPFAAGTRIVDIAHAPNDHYMHQGDLAFVASVPETLDLLRQAIEPREPWDTGTKAALAAAFPQDNAWGPAGIVAEARAVLPAETIATIDSGAHRILLSQMWTTHAPRTLLQSSGFCTMGVAVPMAIGARLAAPDRPVVSFCGDGGMLMVAGELATAAGLGLPVVFVVFVDASLGLIEMKQRGMQLANAGVDMVRHDFAAIGRAFGGRGETVRSRPELRAALQAALEADTFTVIAAEIEPGGYDGRI